MRTGRGKWASVVAAGSVAAVLVAVGATTPAAALGPFTFTNSGAITINDAANATPYPASINVTNLPGTIVDVDVTITGLSHSFPGDVAIMAVSPRGDRVLLDGRVGGGTDVDGIELTFDDEASSSLPSPLTGGRFRPSGTDTPFPAPAPQGARATALSAFDGGSANGTWLLYVVDTANQDAGTITRGWSVTIRTNRGPTASPDSTLVAEDSGGTPIAVLTNDFDPDDDTLAIQGAGAPAHGTAVVDGASITYTPTPNYSGSDSFSYTISDGFVTSVSTVQVTVTASADPPVAEADVLAVPEDAAPAEVPVLANDSDPDPDDVLSVTAVSDPEHGTATLAAGVVSYEPDENYNGADSFTYTLSDGRTTATGRVSVTVTGVNDTPDAVDDTASTGKGTAVEVDVLANDTDADDDDLVIDSHTEPTNGTLECADDGVCTYTPNAEFVGTDSFTYVVSDGFQDLTRDAGAAAVDQATVSITVTAQAQATTTTAGGTTTSAGATTTTAAGAGALARTGATVGFLTLVAGVAFVTGSTLLAQRRRVRAAWVTDWRRRRSGGQ